MRASARDLARKAKTDWFDSDDADYVYMGGFKALKRQIEALGIDYSVLQKSLGWWDTPHTRDVLATELTLEAKEWAARELLSQGELGKRDYCCPNCLSGDFKAGVLKDSDEGVFECRFCRERFRRPEPLLKTRP